MNNNLALPRVDTPCDKIRRVVLKMCPASVRDRYYYRREYMKGRNNNIPEFYPKVYCTSMKFNPKWSDKVLVLAEIQRLDEDCESSVQGL